MVEPFYHRFMYSCRLRVRALEDPVIIVIALTESGYFGKTFFRKSPVSLGKA